MPSGTIAATLPAAGAAVYRPRRPARTLLHKVMRENLETYLTGGDQTGEFDAHVPSGAAGDRADLDACGGAGRVTGDLPARSPPQAEMDFDQVAGTDEWPDMDQTVGEVNGGFSSMVKSGIQAVERGAKYAVGITSLNSAWQNFLLTANIRLYDFLS